MFQVPTRRTLRRLTPGLVRRVGVASASPRLPPEKEEGLGGLPTSVRMQASRGLSPAPVIADPPDTSAPETTGVPGAEAPGGTTVLDPPVTGPGSGREP